MVEKDGQKQSTIAGTGILDIGSFLRLADEQKVDYCVIEQEHFEEDLLSEVEKGVQNVKALL